jgi:hypothetical protein
MIHYLKLIKQITVCISTNIKTKNHVAKNLHCLCVKTFIYLINLKPLNPPTHTLWHRIHYSDNFAFLSHFSSFSLRILLYEERSWYHHAPIHVPTSKTFQ